MRKVTDIKFPSKSVAPAPFDGSQDKPKNEAREKAVENLWKGAPASPKSKPPRPRRFLAVAGLMFLVLLGAFAYHSYKNFEKPEAISSKPLIPGNRSWSDILAAFKKGASQYGLDDLFGNLTAFLGWIENPKPHHVLVVLSNTSELRPGGGFIGSLVDVTLASGTLSKIEALDINEIDNARENLVVPPKPLQAITGRWRAADANWFLDYPSSARKTLDFIKQSNLYASTTLDGLITITPAAVRDILNITGPITLKDGKVISAENFLATIQKEVQDGQASGAAAPKQILDELAPALGDKLNNLSSADQDKLLAAAKNWALNKDVMIYTPDENLARLVAPYKLSGALYSLPDKFEGDYLAVADANIGGGKSDAYIEQEIDFTSRLDVEGILHDEVNVSRVHHGDKAAEWWYKATNWNYLQVFTPIGVSVDGFTGGGVRYITPKVNYQDYATDTDVAELENTLASTPDGKLQSFHESGRNVFATWQKIAAGESKEMKLEYSRRLPEAPRDGLKYIFVFDKQSGANTSLNISLTAPIGFIWKEANSPIYKYASDNPPGQVVLNLTLVQQ